MTTLNSDTPSSDPPKIQLTAEQIEEIANEVQQTPPTDALSAAEQQVMNPIYNGLTKSTEAGAGIIANFLGNIFEIANKDLSKFGNGALQENLGRPLSLKKIKDMETTSLVISMILSNALPGIVANMGTTAIEPFLQNSAQALLLSLKDASMIIPGVPIIYLAGDAVRALSIMSSALVGISAAVAEGLIPAGQEYIQIAQTIKQAQQDLIENQKQQLLQYQPQSNTADPQQDDTTSPSSEVVPPEYVNTSSNTNATTMQTGGRKKSNKWTHKHSTKIIAKRVATSIHRFMETDNIHHTKTKKKIPKNKSSKKHKSIRQ
jgi:hypothetical protein